TVLLSGILVLLFRLRRFAAERAEAGDHFYFSAALVTFDIAGKTERGIEASVKCVATHKKSCP
ncbi:hypothetical protein, partial [Pandoraea sputorum]|uniref:hypothetical protein n=1 Tax=Pandoraea sputorum TaxID=93222 RepID=UPI003556D421